MPGGSAAFRPDANVAITRFRAISRRRAALKWHFTPTIVLMTRSLRTTAILCALTALAALLAMGCATAPPPSYSVIGPRDGGGSRANLALGTRRIHPILAESFAYRSDWPSFVHGYIEDEVTYYADVRYDEQRYYDRNNGIQNVSDMTRLGTFRR